MKKHSRSLQHYASTFHLPRRNNSQTTNNTQSNKTTIKVKYPVHNNANTQQTQNKESFANKNPPFTIQKSPAVHNPTQFNYKLPRKM